MSGRAIHEDEARAAAADALASGLAGDDVVRREGRVLNPIPYYAPDGRGAGWVVPIGLRAGAVGFVQLERDGTFHRYAALPGGPNAAPVQDWFDEARATERAAGMAGRSDQLSRPRLSYDRHPDRLAWEVIATANDGSRRRILVAGDAVWAETVVD